MNSTCVGLQARIVSFLRVVTEGLDVVHELVLDVIADATLGSELGLLDRSFRREGVHSHNF